MNVHYWPAIPLAFAAAVAVAWVIYVEERQRAANPLNPWFDHEDSHASFAEHIGLDPRRWNA